MENLRGIAFMVAAMATFSFGDVLLKIISLSLPIWQILIITGFGGGVLNFFILCLTKTPFFMPELREKAFLSRTMTDMLSALFFVWAIATTPLSSVSAILQTAPLIITLAAVLVYRETVQLGHWIAILFGFIGVLLILRPTSETYQPYAWLAVFATLCVALRDILTRAIADDIPSLTISTHSFFAVGFGGLIVLPFGAQFMLPSSRLWALLGAATFLGALANYMLILATRHGDASVIAPFRYSRLIFSMLLAIIVMNEQPPWQTWLGAIVILVSGCYIFLTERFQPMNKPCKKTDDCN